MGLNPPKIGLIVSDPGDILSGIIDLQALKKKCEKIRGVEHCVLLTDFKSESFLIAAQKPLAEKQIDRLIWIGRFTVKQKCTLEKKLEKSGLNPYLNEWSDLTSQSFGKQEASEEARFKKALTLIKMAVARAKLLEPLETEEVPNSESAVVIGAGISGLHAASALIERGKQVHLVEKESGVGGKVGLLSRFFPLQCNPQCGIEYALKSLRTSEKLTVHTLSKPTSVEGTAGNFSVSINTRPHYVDSNLCNGCGKCADVCPIEIPLWENVIQDEPPFQNEMGIGTMLKETQKAIHLPTPYPFPETYLIERDKCPADCKKCLEVCPVEAINLDEQIDLKQNLDAGALLVTSGWDAYPLSKLRDYYGYGLLPNIIGNLEMEQLLLQMTKRSDIQLQAIDSGPLAVGFVQCAGSRNKDHLSYCSSVCCSATIKQIKQLKSLHPGAKCTVFYQDMRCFGFDEDLYQELKSESDVLFVRGFPRVNESDLIDGKMNLTVEDTFSGLPVNTEIDLLVLAGGMQPSSGGLEFAELSGLPLNKHRFFIGHYQCYPEESQRTGILTAGCARGPMNVSQSIESSGKAAIKALNFLESTTSIAPTYPVVNEAKCDQCKRCIEDCPYDCYRQNEKGFPVPDLKKCRQCGNCMGVCPVSAISMNHFTIKQLANQIEILENSFLRHEEPTVLAFLCENDAYVAACSAIDQGLDVPINVIQIKVPCAGAVNNALIADALSLGIDGVLIAGCKDEQCHYVRGFDLVQKRSGDLGDKLGTMMIEPERVRSEGIEIHESDRYVSLLNEYIEKLTKLGPNPFKI